LNSQFATSPSGASISSLNCTKSRRAFLRRYRTWTDEDKLKHNHTAIVIDSFTLLGRPTFQTGESAPDPDDGDVTVVVDADQSSELHDDNPF
jgi:hypothetical protein